MVGWLVFFSTDHVAPVVYEDPGLTRVSVQEAECPIGGEERQDNELLETQRGVARLDCIYTSHLSIRL